MGYDTRPKTEFQSMRIISINTNGIRAAARKGFFQWLPQQQADVVCIQETKAQIHQLDDPIYHPKDFHCYYVDAQKKGYSGVALYARREPDEIIKGLDWPEMDDEGRCIEARFVNLSVISLYLPSGSSGELRQSFKFQILDKLMERLKIMQASGRDYVICGDWNTAHKEVDLKNWRGNRKNSGFLPEERAWMDDLFGPVGFVDAFRAVNQEPNQYTWWSNRGQAWAKNVGWRIDYQVITPGLADKVQATAIYKEQRFSDHAPLIIDYDDAIPAG